MKNRKLPAWCKEAKKSMIDRDMSMNDLSDRIGMSRVYISQVVNGRTYAPEIAARISKVLDVKVAYADNIV